MIQALPSGGYEYVIVSLDVMFATETDSEIGYFVDVDLEHRVALKNKTR